MIYKVVFNNAVKDDEIFMTKKQAEQFAEDSGPQACVVEVDDMPCPRCNGSGTEWFMMPGNERGIPEPSHDVCSVCDGRGVVEDEGGGEDDNSTAYGME